MAQNILRGTPARVLLLFTLLMTVVAVTAWRDYRRRGKTMTVSYPTALGDTSYFKPDGKERLIALDNAIYTLAVSRGPALQRRDDRMFVLPVPNNLGLRLYTPRAGLAPQRLPPLYVKTGHGEFARVTLRPHQPAP